jgi:hypothetical protein
VEDHPDVPAESAPAHDAGGPRASDADRDRFARLIARHFSEGRLSSEEFSERMDRILRARALGELYALSADLPDLPAVEAPRGTGRHPWRFWRS